MVINENLAKEIGLDNSVVYSVMFLILCTDTYKDKFKGCRVKKEPNTVFITISKLRELIPFMSKSKLYNSVNRLLKLGYIKEANYSLPGTNTTKCYTIGKFKNRIVMNKNIIIKKEKPICQLDGLPGVKRRKVDAYSINNTSDIESTIELGYACTSAGDNGAINVWKDDAGIIRGELMRYCVTVEKRTFTSYAEVEKCVSDWLERINP